MVQAYAKKTHGYIVTSTAADIRRAYLDDLHRPYYVIEDGRNHYHVPTTPGWQWYQSRDGHKHNIISRANSRGDGIGK